MLEKQKIHVKIQGEEESKYGYFQYRKKNCFIIARVKVPNQCKKLPTNSRAEGVLFYLDVILESTKVIQHPMQKHF